MKRSVRGKSKATPKLYSEVRSFKRVSDNKSGHIEYEVCALTKTPVPGMQEVVHKWSVWRRYSEFKQLDKACRNKYGWQMGHITLPPGKVFGNMNPKFAEKRMGDLNRYIIELLQVPSITEFDREIGCDALKEFFQYDAAAVAEGDGDTPAPLASAPSSTSSDGSASALAAASAPGKPARRGSVRRISQRRRRKSLRAAPGNSLMSAAGAPAPAPAAAAAAAAPAPAPAAPAPAPAPPAPRATATATASASAPAPPLPKPPAAALGFLAEIRKLRKD